MNAFSRLHSSYSVSILLFACILCLRLHRYCLFNMFEYMRCVNCVRNCAYRPECSQNWSIECRAKKLKQTEVRAPPLNRFAMTSFPFSTIAKSTQSIHTEQWTYTISWSYSYAKLPIWFTLTHTCTHRSDSWCLATSKTAMRVNNT